jgi:uncharacterized membrane protein YgcG
MAARLTAVALVALALASPASAQTPIIDRAAESARGRSVYIHPGTRQLTAAEAARLERQIEQQGRGPIYIAILPAAAKNEVDGTATGVVLELNRRVITTNPPAVHAVVVGNQFRAVNRDLPAGDLATAAFRAHRAEGVLAVLSDFVRRVGEARRAPATVEPESADDSGGVPFGLLFWGTVAAAIGLFILRRWRRRAQQLADVKAAAREDLVALAEDVTELEAEAERDPEAKEAYLRAMYAYQRADDRFDKARSPRDLGKVSANLAEARFEMATAKALLDGKPAPEPRPPCFFNPRHGPSVRDVVWERPFGGLVKMPACERDAARIAAGEQPDVRTVPVGRERRPFWDAPAYYDPWTAGYIGAAAGVVLAGSASGAAEASPSTVDPGGSGDFWGGGDFGGGDLGGGGDFGGGGNGGG